MVLINRHLMKFYHLSGLLLFVVFLFWLLNFLPLSSTKLISSRSFQPTQTASPSTVSPELLPAPTLDTIFALDHSWVAALSSETITLVATGDVMLGRVVNLKSVQKNDFFWPWLLTAEILRSADLTLINLESPLGENCPLTNTGMVFCAKNSHTDALASSGVDVVNLANNHLADQKLSGAAYTKDQLQATGFLTIGMDQPVFKKVKNTTFAFLGFNDIPPFIATPRVDTETITSEIILAKPKANLVVVSFHFGEEYTETPTARQRLLAYTAIDAGADLVIGHHPHWIQPLEIYQGKPILYSHGNFIFDQMWSDQTRLGLVSRFTYFNDQLIDLELMPVKIFDYGQPRFLTGKPKENLLQDLYRFSQEIND
ncbi:CapA family protein [Candidatus Collierbacteria bacterium]|nr:CapA family protein [Candidatus Collierbacteria bacterium]